MELKKTNPKTSFPSNFRVWSQFQWQKITLFCWFDPKMIPLSFFLFLRLSWHPGNHSWSPFRMVFLNQLLGSWWWKPTNKDNILALPNGPLRCMNAMTYIHVYRILKYIYIYCIHILGRTWVLHSRFLWFLTMFQHHLTQCGPSFIKTFNSHQFPNAVLLDHLWWKNHHQRHHNGIHTDHRSISDVLE